MNVDVTGAYIYFIIPIFGGIPVTQTALSVLLVTVLLMVGGVLLGKRVKKRPGTMQVLVEKGIGMLEGIVKDTMGEHNVGWTPYIATVFMSSICGSYIGLTGFLRSSTADLSVPLTWALMTTAIIWYQSIKRNGVLGWLKGFTEPVVVMTPHESGVGGGPAHLHGLPSFRQCSRRRCHYLHRLHRLRCPVLPGNRPGERLRGGTGCGAGCGRSPGAVGHEEGQAGKKDSRHCLCGCGSPGLLQYFGILSNVPIFQFGIPAVLSVYFDLFSGFVQAFVFSMLSMAYIGAACPPPEEAKA